MEVPKRGEYGFLCPNKKCDSAKQGKVRLWVNPELEIFNCWHCSMRGKSLATLMVAGSNELRQYLETRSIIKPQKQLKPRCDSLPAGFTPFSLDGSFQEKPYLSYLGSRNITVRTLVNYRMGYITSGRYARRIVIPSFDRFGMINFWSARSIDDVDHVNRYRLADASKDIISNEHMVDWTKDVFLVEGIFDEIAIGSQAIALNGKDVMPSLLMKLIEFLPPTVYLCLDDDAKSTANDIANELIQYGINCSLVSLNGKDPSAIGKNAVIEAASKSTIISSQIDMLRARINSLTGSR